MTNNIPQRPENSFRVTLTTSKRELRLDVLLLQALRDQDENLELKRISRSSFKKLFTEKKILIKGQAAKPSSAIAAGTTYIDILGFDPQRV